ncbi:MAG: hypothetical protein NVS1B9_05140 [Solirubrobacteraceae bacterium]
MSAAPAPAQPLRVDAQRNRERIVAAARVAFAERGVDIGVEEIARLAGVGMGTLYRRFPTKEALVLAIFEERLDALAVLAKEVASLPPLPALERFIARACQDMHEDRGLLRMLAERRFRHTGFTERAMQSKQVEREQRDRGARQLG